MVLFDQVKTVEFKDKMEEIEKICQIENNGATTLKDIELFVSYDLEKLLIVYDEMYQRAACQHFDRGNGDELVRLEDDGAPKHAGPHIYAVKVNK